MKRSFLLTIVGGWVGLVATLVCGSTAAQKSAAQSWPTHPIRLVVTYPPGGGADIMARLLAPNMAETLGQPVVVENKAGASGQIAAIDVARSAPDGYTLMLDASSYSVNPSLYEKLPYDPAKVFTPISVLALFPQVLLVAPNFAPRDVMELVALARSKPGEIAFASSGNGSAQHLAGELFRQKTGVVMIHVPYKGGAPALNDLMGGQVPMFFGNTPYSIAPVKAGRIRALAVTGAKRSAALPDTPTMHEAGVPGCEVYEWNAVFAPAGTPAPVVARIAESIAKALATAEVRERILSLGGEIVAYGPAESERFVREQAAQWGQVVRQGHIKPE